MARVLRRPMFRLGGNTDQGIMSGVAPRQRYENGEIVSDSDYDTNFRKKLAMLKNVALPPDRSLSNLMIDWGMDIGTREPSGSIFSTALASAKEPFQSYKQSQAERGQFGTKLALTAAESAMAHRDKMKQIAEAGKYKQVGPSMDEKIEKLAMEYMDDYSGDLNLARNKATFYLQTRAEIASKFGESQVGGIIDQGELADEQTTKKWMKRNKDNIGKVFYDINDATVKQLAQQPDGTLGFIPIDLAAIAAGSQAEVPPGTVEQKVASTGLSDAQAETEAAKRGLILIKRPEDAPRGWRSQQKRNNPDAITKAELEEIIRQEEFKEATESVREGKTKVR